MAQHIGSTTVTSTGTSGITGGVMIFNHPVNVQQTSDGSVHLPVGGQGQGAENDAVPIQPHDREPGIASVLVSEMDIEMLSEKLGAQYEDLGPRLGISGPEMEILVIDCSRIGVKHVTRKMLQKWRNGLGPDATRGNLAEKLTDIKRVDLATELLQRPSC